MSFADVVLLGVLCSSFAQGLGVLKFSALVALKDLDRMPPGEVRLNEERDSEVLLRFAFDPILECRE